MDRPHMKNWFLTSKYGLYVTWAFEGPRGACGCFPDGRVPGSFEELADGFDAVRFADDCARFGVQYVNFTAYHAHMNVLFPSSTLDRHIQGHTIRRDIIRELIDALHSRGIRLQLYIHATIGDSMTEEERQALGWYDGNDGYRRWNDFINEFFGELVNRYGTDIDSYYLDMIFHEPFLEMIDRPRLLRTLTSRDPGVVVVGNGQANDSVHYGSREDAMVLFGSPDERPAYPTQTVVCLTGTWWSIHPSDAPSAVRYSAEHLFRYLVLTASANAEGGGLAIGASPYVTMGYEPGVRETLTALGDLVRPVSGSILDTVPSGAYVTPAGARIPDLPGGCAATRSPDGTREYIHVLAPPEGNSIVLPTPLDRSRYKAARMFRTGRPAVLTQTDGSVRIDVPDEWDVLDTVIVLERAAASDEMREVPSVCLSADGIRASCEESLEGHGPEALLDGDPSTYWCTPEGILHTVLFDLGNTDELCGIRVLPRQDRSVESLVTQITSYALYAGTEPGNLRAVRTGEWKRTYEEKVVRFPPVKARYVRLDAGPEWLPPDWRVYPRSAAAAAGITFLVIAR